MKILIIFLISFNCFANYALKSEVDLGSVSKVFTKKPVIGDYLKLPKGYNSNYHIVVDEIVNDYDSPINSKSESEPCVDQPNCEAKNLIKTCLDQDERVLMAQDFSDIYCSKITGYNQKLSGNSIVVEDSTKKAKWVNDTNSAKSDDDSRKSDLRAIKKDIMDDKALSSDQVKKLRLFMLKKFK